MEERPPASAPLETYVVQVPRDQIYRVPPPEHALKIEEHKRNSLNQNANRRSLICSLVIPILLIAALVGVAILTVRATLYAPTPPEFAVTGIQGKDLEQRRTPEFKATVQAKNRNARMSVVYKGGGEATLFFKNREIGRGKIGSGGGGDLAVVLAGNGVSTEMRKGLSDDKEKSMGLKFELRVEMKSWVKNEGMDMIISCDFRVRNSFVNVTDISFQQCKIL